MTKLSADQRFFYDNAGSSYTPGKETKEQGKIRGAKNLAAAEGIARNAGMSFDWEIDAGTDSSDFSDEQPAWSLWACVARDSAGKACSSLCGIDFGRDGEPWGNDYRRVVEAELASESINELLEQIADGRAAGGGMVGYDGAVVAFQRFARAALASVRGGA